MGIRDWLSSRFGKGSVAGASTGIELTASVRIIEPDIPAPKPYPRMPAVGYLDARCANCHGALAKKPGRKAKCPLCGEFNFIRTRPHDLERVVVNAAQVLIIEEQWATINGTLDDLLAGRARVESIRAILTERFGRPPTENDISWYRLNEDAIAASVAGRDPRIEYYEMSQILRKEGKHDQSAAHLMAACVMDMQRMMRPREDHGLPPTDFEKHWNSLSRAEKLRASMFDGIIGRLSGELAAAGVDTEPAARKLFDSLCPYFITKARPVQSEEAWRAIWLALQADA